MKVTDLPNYQLATIAVALLGGDAEYIDREDIAIRLDQLAPGRFRWRKYPDRIDLVVVVNALGDAKKSKNGKLLIGGNVEGWMLSPNGLRWINKVDLAREAGEDQAVEYRKHSIEANQEAERIRLRATAAYELFTSNRSEEISLQDFRQFARVNEYFQARAKRRRYTIVEGAVTDDETLSRLWCFLKVEFPEEMT